MYRGTSPWFAALPVAAAVAFWPQYLSKLPRGIDGHTHLHAALLALFGLAHALSGSRRRSSRASSPSCAGSAPCR